MFVFLFLFAFLNQASASNPFPKITSFNFPSFTPSSCSDGNLTCMGSVTSHDGYLSLTLEPQPGDPTLQLNQVGRVIYRYSVPAWPAIIQTKFTFRILTSPDSTESADGLSFIMAPSSSPSPPDSYGSYLGIMDPTLDGHAAGQLAVEFDTYKNTYDLDANHVAVDTKSVRYPIRVRSLNNSGIDLLTSHIPCQGPSMWDSQGQQGLSLSASSFSAGGCHRIQSRNEESQSAAMAGVIYITQY